MKTPNQEFIGSLAKVIETGLEGTIINETKNTFIIKVNEKTKTIIKNNHKFIINGKTIIGKEISKRPEDRTKQ